MTTYLFLRCRSWYAHYLSFVFIHSHFDAFQSRIIRFYSDASISRTR